MAVNWKEIDRLALAYRKVNPTSSEADLLRQLKIWWCLKYNRPFKDPLLESYTIDELAFEYLAHFYLNPDNDPEKKKQNEQLQKADEEWALKQLRDFQKSNESKDSEKTPEPILPDLPEVSTQFKE